MPMRLYRDEELVGLISGYGYETPWASGIFEDCDAGRGERCERAAAFRMWQNSGADLLEDDDAYDEICEREMVRRGVAQADIEWCFRGSWVIRTQDGVDHPAYSFEFLGDRYVQWRW